jgi:hypothetical protein
MLSFAGFISCGHPPENVTCYRETPDTAKTGNSGIDTSAKNNNKDQNAQKNDSRDVMKRSKASCYNTVVPPEDNDK